MRARAGAALAAHGHAELLRLEDAGGAPRPDVRHERVGDLAREVLLQDEPVREGVHEPHQLAEADDLPARHVGDVGDPPGREQVVRADGVEVDPGHRHEVAPGAREAAGEDLGGIVAVAVHQVLEPGLGDAAGGLGEVRAAAHRRGQAEGVEEPGGGLRGGGRIHRGGGRAARRQLPNAHSAPGR